MNTSSQICTLTIRTGGFLWLLLLGLLGGCSTVKQPPHGHVHDTARPAMAERQPAGEVTALDLAAVSTLDNIIPQLAEKRVVLVGETHTRYDHHLVQLEIIRRLHALHPRLAIGVEFFQQPYQAVLDDYLAGRISEAEMLSDTEYYQRWRYDYRLYRPILDFAREHRLPVIALNLPTEITRKLGDAGRAGLAEEERAVLPTEIDRSDTGYEQRLRQVYAQHPDVDGHGFDNFLEVQLAWDEAMAERAADYLQNHPDTVMVLLAGNGHLAYGSGIPRRLTRRLALESAIVLNDWEGEPEPGLADFLLLPRKQSLPPAGKFGALLEEQDGVLMVDRCLADSPCQRAGIVQGDRFISINGRTTNTMAQLRQATWDKRPGEMVNLRIERMDWLKQPQELIFDIELH